MRQGRRLLLLLLVALAAALLVAGLVRTSGHRATASSAGAAKAASSARAHGSATTSKRSTAAKVLRVVGRGSSRPVRDMVAVPHSVVRQKAGSERDLHPSVVRSTVVRRDGALQTKKLKTSAPAPLTSFTGITDSSQGDVTGFDNWPPDSVGDVGPNYYVEAVNTAFAVYNKTGQKLAGPIDLRQLWVGTSGLCKTHDDGDPIVLYDPLADRWLISQFAVKDPNQYEECIAISKSSDPRGAYWTYDILTSTTVFPDYPKFGVWPDAYYGSYNNITAKGEEAGSTVVAYDRASMLNGGPAHPISIQAPDATSPLMPADFDGTTLPPDGSPETFLGSRYPTGAIAGSDALILYQFHADFSVPGSPGSSSWTRITPALATASFDPNMCGFVTNCVPQPKTAAGIDAESDRPMWRLAYRNFGDHESMVVNQTVRATGQRAGVRWYELRKSGTGNWAIYQQGTFSPDRTNRWMASAAMDKNGDIAVGYSASSSSVYPSLRYAVRTPTDPRGSLRNEKTLVAGNASYTNRDHRWGDYSAMNVDPTDQCTFWYVGEYAAGQTGPSNWRTRIGSFRLPSCK